MAFGYTYTLPTITGSHTDQTVQLKAPDFPTDAINGGGSSILNGGGNLRAYTDATKTTQLSVDVDIFVTGVSPDVSVWVKTTAQTGETIYIEADSVATTQPAFTAPFGRNSVHTFYGIFTSHMNNATPIDSTGNNTSISATDTSVVSAPFGQALDFNGSTSFVDLGAAILPTGDFTQSIWINPDSLVGFQGVMGNWVSGATGRTYVGLDGTSVNWDGYATSGNTRGTIATNNWYCITVTRTGSTVAVSIDGVQQGSTITDAGTPNAAFNTVIGALNTGSSNFFNGQIGEARLSNSFSSLDRISTLCENINSVGTWGTVGAWADSGGGTIYEVSFSLNSVSSTSIGANIIIGAGMSLASSSAMNEQTQMSLSANLTINGNSGIINQASLNTNSFVGIVI